MTTVTEIIECSHCPVAPGHLPYHKLSFMKTNKALIIAAAAGLAVAGLVAFLTFTESGKKATKKWTIKGKKMAGRADDIIKDAKKKFRDLKEEFAGEFKDDIVTQSYE